VVLLIQVGASGVVEAAEAQAEAQARRGAVLGVAHQEVAGKGLG
jgi:hypothetical protein